MSDQPDVGAALRMDIKDIADLLHLAKAFDVKTIDVTFPSKLRTNDTVWVKATFK